MPRWAIWSAVITIALVVIWKLYMPFDLMPTIMNLQSTDFVNGESIPHKYTCDGMRTLNPPLSFFGVPEGTLSLALTMEDPDVPREIHADGTFVHWVVYDIPPETTEIQEGVPIGTQGINSSGSTGYTGPCPPGEYTPSEHRYIFTLYALDAELGLSPGESKDQLLAAMSGHILGHAKLMGRYKRE